jgi:hypothetical protein
MEMKWWTSSFWNNPNTLTPDRPYFNQAGQFVKQESLPLVDFWPVNPR